MTNEERFRAIFQDQVNRPGADDLLEWLENAGFFTAPASTKYHGAYPGGLVDHSLRVYDFLISSPYAVGTSAESRAICALLHDVCKVEYYEPKDDGGYRVNDQFPFGHGEKSVYQISRFMYLTDEEALAIRWHMGAYDDAARGGSRTLSAALSLFPIVFALHTADMWATESEKTAERESSGGPGPGDGVATQTRKGGRSSCQI